MKGEKNGSAKAERQNKGGTEQEDVQCVEVEGPDCVGFVARVKSLNFFQVWGVEQGGDRSNFGHTPGHVL